MRSLLTVVTAFAASVGLTSLFLRWLEGRRIVAVENHRTMHKGVVPTGGGWPLLAVAFLSAALFWPYAGIHAFLLPGALALALVSWMDDVNALGAAPRLAIHAAAAGLAVAALPPEARVFQGAVPLVADRVLAALALVWFMNLYNFMDGIDGIAGVETITLGTGYAAISAATGEIGPLQGLALALAAASAGFLVWNWSPARIFLGDVGSVPLGFLTGVLMIDLAVRHSLTAALILPLYFVADATLTLLSRLSRGERPWEAHRDHFYQRAARGLGSHAAVVKRVALANAMLLIAAVLAVTAPLPGAVLALAVVTLLLISLSRASRA